MKGLPQEHLAMIHAHLARLAKYHSEIASFRGAA